MYESSQVPEASVYSISNQTVALQMDYEDLKASLDAMLPEARSRLAQYLLGENSSLNSLENSSDEIAEKLKEVPPDVIAELFRAIATLMQGNLWRAWTDGQFALLSAPD